jgi:prepilin-type N-terminal cleavage/methylation domain-containing protein/uncharacterized repeat protein (TIGR01451 family)
MAERRFSSRRDGGFTLVEMLISVAITGIIIGVLSAALSVAFSNNAASSQRFNGANDALTATNLFSSDVSAAPPGGREDGEALGSECAGGDAAGSFNVLRLTWTQQAAGTITYYRVAYRLVNDSATVGNMVRISCTSTTGPHAGYGASGSRLIASSLTAVPVGWTKGNAPAALSYSPPLDTASDLRLILTVNTKPAPTTVTVSGQRSNPGVTLPAAPLANATSVIRLLTSATTASYSTVGAVLNYSTLVLNAGTNTLSSVGIADAKADGGSISCGASFLVSGGTTTCTFTHTATQADLDAASVVSTTTATGTPPSGPPATGSSTAVTVPADQNPSMTVAKAVSPTTCLPSPCYKLAGEVLNYTATVTNSGNVTLSSVALTDTKMTGAASCAPTTLAPGATSTCTYHYTVVAGDLVVGNSINTTATATATSPPAASPVSATSPTVGVPFHANPSINATKASASPPYTAAGQALTYTITVTNTGNVSLSAVSVADPKDDDAVIPCVATTLAAGASTTCTVVHTTTATDVTNGSVVNQATATGTPASGGGPISASTNTVTITYNSAASMTITKAVSATTCAPSPCFKNVGDILDYVLTVTNTGGVTLTSVAAADPKDSDGIVLCGTTTLAPAVTTTCAARHVVVAGDLGNPIVNTATSSAASAGGPASATSNTISVNFIAAPKLSVTITSPANGSTFTTRNAVITYSMTVTNTGNVALTSVGITAATLGWSSGPSCLSASLAVAASTTCTGTYTTTDADSTGSVTNAVTASGTYNLTVYAGVSSSITVNSAVPCFVRTITAIPSAVARNGSGNNKQHLAQDVAITVTTGGVTCSGLRIEYYPGNPASVIAALTNGAANTWTYTMQSNGNSASDWTTTGAKQVDVLPSSGSTFINTTTFTPFTVTS